MYESFSLRHCTSCAERRAPLILSRSLRGNRRFQHARLRGCPRYRERAHSREAAPRRVCAAPVVGLTLLARPNETWGRIEDEMIPPFPNADDNLFALDCLSVCRECACIFMPPLGTTMPCLGIEIYSIAYVVVVLNELNSIYNSRGGTPATFAPVNMNVPARIRGALQGHIHTPDPHTTPVWSHVPWTYPRSRPTATSQLTWLAPSNAEICVCELLPHQRTFQSADRALIQASESDDGRERKGWMAARIERYPLAAYTKRALATSPHVYARQSH